MKVVDVDSLWKCETCFHHQNGKCNTWCDALESYRPAYSKLKIMEIKVDEQGNIISIRKEN